MFVEGMRVGKCWELAGAVALRAMSHLSSDEAASKMGHTQFVVFLSEGALLPCDRSSMLLSVRA